MRVYWVDLETTGLSPVRDVILEYAIVEADFLAPFTPLRSKSGVLHYRRSTIADGTIDPAVIAMHTKNRLWEECALSLATRGSVQDELVEWIGQAPDDPEEWPVLGGSTVHFDQAFLQVHMPKVLRRFSHRLYDVSAVKLFCRSLGMPPIPKGGAHRAMADILETISHAKGCALWLRDQDCIAVL